MKQDTSIVDNMPKGNISLDELKQDIDNNTKPKTPTKKGNLFKVMF